MHLVQNLIIIIGGDRHARVTPIGSKPLSTKDTRFVDFTLRNNLQFISDPQAVTWNSGNLESNIDHILVTSESARLMNNSELSYHL
jgi:hypothetical protein